MCLSRNPESPDKLFKIRPFLVGITARFKAAYNPKQDLSVDESMVPWKGRLSFRMFIPSKPTRYGIKLYCCCEAETGYVCRMQVYTGAGPNGPEKNHGENVVKRLTEDFLGQGHIIYMDSFFTSVALFEYLRANNTMAVGTVRAGRVGIPRCLHTKVLKLKKGERRFRRKGNLLCMRMKDRRDFFLLSTKHTTALTVGDDSNSDDERNQPTLKPQVVVDYNQHMKGVDQFDQNLGYYSFHRKTLKWWKRMAMHLIHLCKVQAYILYKMCAPRPKSQLQFTKELIRELLSGVPMKKPARVRQPTAERLVLDNHFITNCPPTPTEQHPTRTCTVCSFRDPSGRKRYLRPKKTAYFCEQCEVPLCFKPCFKLYHTKTDYKTAAIAELNLDLPGIQQ